MHKFQKKPITIQAVQWDGRAGTIFPMAPFENATKAPEVNEDGTLDIATLEGVMKADVGDFIIKGLAGEVYPCKEDIFWKTYDQVDQADSPKEGEQA